MDYDVSYFNVKISCMLFNLQSLLQPTTHNECFGELYLGKCSLGSAAHILTIISLCFLLPLFTKKQIFSHSLLYRGHPSIFVSTTRTYLGIYSSASFTYLSHRLVRTGTITISYDDIIFLPVLSRSPLSLLLPKHLQIPRYESSFSTDDDDP